MDEWTAQYAKTGLIFPYISLFEALSLTGFFQSEGEKNNEQSREATSKNFINN